MRSRILFGAAMLATIAASLTTAVAARERDGERPRLIDRIREKRSQPSDGNATAIARPGTYRFHFAHGGLRREYIVHVPRRLERGRPAPVLVALHGGGGDMDHQAKRYGLIEKSEEAGFIAVFPSGYSRLPGGILATWNAGKCCGKARDNEVDDVGFIREVIQRVVRQTGADRSRVFVTGMSNGGMMAYRLACELPHLVRGIAPVAGTDNTATCASARPVPIIHFHALDDGHVLFNGGAGKDAFRNRDAITEFTSVASTVAKWVAINRAIPQARRVLTVPGAKCDIHSAGSRGAPVKLCVTESGGHSWPGADYRRPGKPPASQAVDANDLMWDFFSSL